MSGQQGETAVWQPDHSKVRVEDLPLLMQDLAHLAGVAAVLKLSEWRGGTLFSVPRKTNGRAGRALSDAIGEEAARRLLRHYGGARISIPGLRKILRPLLAREIRAAYDAGATVVEIVRRFDTSERHVRRTLNSAEQPGT